METILFDLFYAQPHNNVKYHGGGEYTKTVFFHLVGRLADGHDLQVLMDATKYLDKEIIDVIKRLDITVHDVRNIKDIYRTIEKASQKERVLFFTGMIYPYIGKDFPDNVFSIGVCHGLRMMEMPKDRYSILYAKTFKLLIRELFRMIVPSEILYTYSRKKYIGAMQRFCTVYTVSQHSYYSIVTRCFNNDFNTDLRVHCQTLKYNSHKILINDNKLEQIYPADGYILMVSADRWEKNSLRGVNALDSLISDGYLNNHNIIVLGNYPMRLRRRVKNKGKFIFRDYVSADELEYAYKNCSLFFYPSLNEGYGLPPMEAMKYHKTCVVSAVCSLTEVYGDAVYYCNPYDIGEMKVRIVEALNVPISASTIEKKNVYLTQLQYNSTQELISVLLGENNVE